MIFEQETLDCSVIRAKRLSTPPSKTENFSFLIKS